MTLRRVARACIAVFVVAAACGGHPTTALAAQHAWARPTPAGAANGVVYARVSSDIDDEIVGADVDSSIAERIELHAGDAGGTGGHVHGAANSSGLATMQTVEAIAIDGGATIRFQPGGNHLMLLNLARPLVAGEQFEISLHMRTGRVLKVPVLVAENEP